MLASDILVMFKKSGKDSCRISSLRRQSGTHVV